MSVCAFILTFTLSLNDPAPSGNPIHTYMYECLFVCLMHVYVFTHIHTCTQPIRLENVWCTCACICAYVCVSVCMYDVTVVLGS